MIWQTFLYAALLVAVIVTAASLFDMLHKGRKAAKKEGDGLLHLLFP